MPKRYGNGNLFAPGSSAGFRRGKSVSVSTVAGERTGFVRRRGRAAADGISANKNTILT